MSRIAQTWQNRRTRAKGRRDIQKAINSAGTPGMRAELIAIASRTGSGVYR